MKKKYRREMDYVYAVIHEMERKLDRPIRDLDDVRLIMDTLKKIREQEVEMDLRIDPIEVTTCFVIKNKRKMIFILGSVQCVVSSQRFRRARGY